MNACKETSATVAILSFQNNTDIIGAKYIHAYLLANGIDSRLILVPFSNSSSDDAVVAFLMDRHIRVVGMSIMTPESPRAFACANKIKTALPETLLVFGGIHATVDPKDCLEHGDVAVRGEGELAFLEIVRRVARGEDTSGTPGTCIKRDGQLLESPPALPIDDLDPLPFPRHLPSNMYVVHHGSVQRMDRSLFPEYARYGGRFVNITTTRGCPFACTYCCNSAYRKLYSRWTIRSRSVSSVIEELVFEKSAHPDLITVNIQDDCFLANNREWMTDFAERYKFEVGIPFILRTTPAHISRDVLLLLKQAGLIWIMLGLQSGSNRVNREIYRRPVTQSQFLEAARIIHEVGICAVYDVILDNPYETESDILETLETVLSIPRPFQFQIFSLRFFKGTELQERLARDGVSATNPCVNYMVFEPTVLNRLIKMAAVYPPIIVRWLTVHRRGYLCQIAIRIMSLVSDVVLTPFSYLCLTHKAYGSRMATTAGLFGCLAKTFLQQRVFSKRR
jgi:anaerobic magnesium-protoporphyrin IX monomethyl ester cyclase